MTLSPTQLSLKYLRSEGWTVAVVEHWNSFTRSRYDLFGFADLLAMQEGRRPLLVQTTAGAWTDRLRKVRASPAAWQALGSGFDIEVHGWRKLAANKNRMTIIITPVTRNDTWTVETTSEARMPAPF